jgi:hypothetical protein
VAFKACDSAVTPNTLYLDLTNPVKYDNLLRVCGWSVGAASSTSVRLEIWRKLPNNQLINVYTHPKWISASDAKLNPVSSTLTCSVNFRFYAKAGDLIGFRCSDTNPITYLPTWRNKPGQTLVGEAVPAATDGSSVTPLDAFKLVDRVYAYTVLGTKSTAGHLLVLNDEYILSDTGLQQAPDTEAFAKNITRLFIGKMGACKFLVYSNNPRLLGPSLEKAIKGIGGVTLEKGRSTPLNLDTLRTYDAIFVGGEPTDNQMLIDFIKSGGSVCLIAGTGHGDSQSEAAQWSQLLAAFGMRLDTSYNTIQGVLPVTSPDHPLFTGVKGLFQYWGQTIHLLPDSKASMLMTDGSQGLIAYATVPV